MGWIIVLALLLASGWILFVAFRRLAARRAGIGWWLALCILLGVGAGIGYRLGFDFEYSVSPNLRIVGVPIPVGFFHFEDGHWIDFPPPKEFAYFAALTNFLIMTALAVLPLLLASLLHHRKPKTAQSGESSSDNLQ
jgi:hypothetical protein